MTPREALLKAEPGELAERGWGSQASRLPAGRLAILGTAGLCYEITPFGGLHLTGVAQVSAAPRATG
jgi:hypothetical protein